MKETCKWLLLTLTLCVLACGFACRLADIPIFSAFFGPVYETAASRLIPIGTKSLEAEPKSRLVRSQEALKLWYHAWQSAYDYDFFDTLEEYDADFFASNALVLYVSAAGSSSSTFAVSRVQRQGSHLKITLKDTHRGNAYNADIMCYFALIEIPLKGKDYHSLQIAL